MSRSTTAHRADRQADAPEGPRRQRGRHRAAAGPAGRPCRVRAGERAHRQGQEGAGHARAAHPRHHEGVARDRVVPLGGVLPGDDEGADRRVDRGQDRPPARTEGERDHREADPGRDRSQAVPRDRHLAGRAGRPRALPAGHAAPGARGDRPGRQTRSTSPAASASIRSPTATPTARTKCPSPALRWTTEAVASEPGSAGCAEPGSRPSEPGSAGLPNLVRDLDVRRADGRSRTRFKERTWFETRRSEPGSAGFAEPGSRP